jgi:multisubunit Na+/H+ antiporter MnhG subunit
MLALRKGADAIPYSWLVLLLSVGMLVISSVCAAALIDGMSSQNYLLTFSGYSLGLIFYGVVLFISGYSRRILQTISAIVACGAIITLLYVAEYVIFDALFGAEFASVVGLLIIFWSVPVEGHIIAHAIQQHRFVGIMIAMAALILQLWFQSTLVADS